MTFADFFTTAAKKYADAPVFVIRRRVRKEIVTYRQLPDHIAKIDQLLSIQKIKPKDKILIWGANSPEYALLLATCFSTGRIAVPIDLRTSRETVLSIVKKVKPKAVFVSKFIHSDFLKTERMTMMNLEDIFALTKIITAAPKLSRSPALADPNRLCEIVFTSGTTGDPKGVRLSQENLLGNLEQILPYLPNLDSGRMISVLPLSHVFEQVIGLLLPIQVGATLFYLPRINSFTLLRAFAEYKPTHQIFVPQLLKLVWGKIETEVKNQGGQVKFSRAMEMARFLPLFARRWLFADIHAKLGGNLKLVASGGAPLDAEVAQNWLRIGLPVIEGYGATEVTAVATINSLGNIRLGTVGRVVTGVKLHVDANGEIYIQSPSVSLGYYDDPKRTQAVFTKEGYKTGDIGSISADGYVTIKGRDVFKIVLENGEKVFVEDIEKEAKKDFRIRDICILGKKTDSGDKIHALILRSETNSTPVSEIVRDINLRLESKQQIESFEAWDEDFPRTPTLKINRKQLSAYVNHHMPKVELRPTQPTTFHDIIDIVATLGKKNRRQIVQTDVLANDLGLDSLNRTELVALSEEHLGIAIDESKITAQTTVTDLLKLTQTGEQVEDVTISHWQFSAWGCLARVLFWRLILFPVHNCIIHIKYPSATLPRILPGSIVLMNHPGFGDVVCTLRTLDRLHQKKVVTATDPEFWQKRGFMAKFMELSSGSIPIFRSGHKFLIAMQRMSDLLDDGHVAIYAPQGQLQRTDAEVPFMLGIGYILKEVRAPVTIIKIVGYREIWPARATAAVDTKLKDMLPKKSGTVHIYVSDPIHADWQNMSVQEITTYVEKRYHRLGVSKD